MKRNRLDDHEAQVSGTTDGTRRRSSNSLQRPVVPDNYEPQLADDRPERELERINSRFEDKGIVETRIDSVPPEEYRDVWTSSRSHKYSRESIEESLRTLPEVQRRRAAGAKTEDFKDMQYSTNPEERAIGNTYSTYFGSDCIKISRGYGRTTVVNGRHRLAAAAEAGMDELPMRVVEERERGSDR